jgi:putative ABC transport system ATP-binding protein
MNKFWFRRSGAKQVAPAPPATNEDVTQPGGTNQAGATHESRKQESPKLESPKQNGESPQSEPQRTGEPKRNLQYALTSENGTPKTLSLTEPTSKDAVALLTPTPASSNAATHSPAAASVIVPARGEQNNDQAAKNGQALIQLNDVVKAYQTPVGEFMALRGINLAIGRGEFVAVVGKSGSGKSTLINMITGIDRPTSGEIFIDSAPIHHLAEGPMAEWRGRNVGIIFQFFQLLPMLSCIENVMLPMDFCNMFRPSEREARALHLLEQVDMVEHAYKLPSEVSGGQQQRVAIARALANDPPLLVADEPTGNLDSRTAEAVFHLFERMVDDGKTILMVTHDDEMAHQVRRTITIADGRIVQQDYHREQAAPLADGRNGALEGDGQAAVAGPATVST